MVFILNVYSFNYIQTNSANEQCIIKLGKYA